MSEILRDRKLRYPSRRYKKCKVCGSTDLTRSGVDILCMDCDWDTTAETVQVGLMDDIVQAARENFSVSDLELLYPNEEDRNLEDL